MCTQLPAPTGEVQYLTVLHYLTGLLTAPNLEEILLEIPAEIRNTAAYTQQRYVCVTPRRSQDCSVVDAGKKNPRKARIQAQVKHRRLAAGMTQGELATELKAVDPTLKINDQRQVSHWEVGDYEPSWPYVRALAKVFGCDVTDLYQPIPEEAAA